MIKVVGGGSIVDMEALDSPDSPGVVDSIYGRHEPDELRKVRLMSLTSCGSRHPKFPATPSATSGMGCNERPEPSTYLTLLTTLPWP